MPRRRARASLDGDRARWWFAFAVFAALGALWALSSPLMSIPDEPAHAVKAAAVANGQLRGRDELVTQGDANGPPRLDTHVEVPEFLANANDYRRCFSFRASVPAGCAPAIRQDATPTDATTTAGTYPPLYYLLVGWPSRLWSGAGALYGMRLASVAVGAALLASGLTSARRAGLSHFTVAGAALAATPMAYFLIGSINPNGFEIAAAFATWLAWLELLNQREVPTARLLVRVVVVSSAFLLARPLSPAFFALTVGAVAAMALTRPRLRTLVAQRSVRLAAVAVTAVGLASLAWILWSVTNSASAAESIPGLTFVEGFRGSYDQLWFRTRGMVAVFGWLDTSAPVWVTLGWLAGTGVLVVLALVVGTWRRRLVLLVTVVATIVAPLAAEAAGAPRIGYVWQGRYSLPLAMGVPILAAWIAADRYEPPDWLRPTRGAALVAAAVGTAVAQFVAQSFALTRYIVGLPAPYLAYVRGDGWAPPLARWGLFALAAAACLASACLFVAVGQDPAASERFEQPTDEAITRMIVPGR